LLKRNFQPIGTKNGEKCLKCGYERKDKEHAPDYECPSCGAIYAKVEANRGKTPSNRDIKQQTPKSPKPPKPAKEPKHVISFRELHLKTGERIVQWGEGYIGKVMGKKDDTQHNGVLLVTDERVVFYRKGLLGEVLEEIKLNKVTSINRRKSLFKNIIEINSGHDEINFNIFDAEKLDELVNAIETTKKTKSIGEEAKPSNNADPMEALKKLGELKQLGVITEEEFQEKKSYLLDKL